MSAANLAGLIGLVEDGTINRNTGKAVFETMLEEGLTAREVVERDGLAQVSDSSELEQIVQSVLDGMDAELTRYHNGEKKLFGHFMGAVMSATKGKGDPNVVRQLLKSMLDG